MNDVINIFYKLQQTSSKNEKIKIIKENSNNELLKKCLQFLLDDNIVTGISKKKINKNLIVTDELFIPSVSSWEECMDYLKIHNTGTTTDIREMQEFINAVPPENKEFYIGMITKSLKIGCDSKTVNTAIPNLISTWEVQQAYPISDKNAPKNNQWFALSRKLNGTNCGYIDGCLISRQGKRFKGLEHIIKDINNTSFKDMFFNGELTRKNIDNIDDNDNFQIGTGIINSDDTDKSLIEFVIYEVFPKEEFLQGESKLTYKDRRNKYLVALTEEIDRLELKNIRVVPLVYSGSNINKIEYYLNKANELGWEGLMLNKDTKWKNKRNNGILKIKSFKNADLICTNVIEGEGKFRGTLGLIECDYHGFTLGVGSGFSDKQRRYYWKHPDEIIGKIVQIKYKNETKNKQGGLSVQFPIFQCVRNDKDTPSYN